MAENRNNGLLSYFWAYLKKNQPIHQWEAEEFITRIGAVVPRNINTKMEKLGYIGVDRVQYVNCNYEPLKPILSNSRGSLDTYYVSLGYPSRWWQFCVYGPSNEEDIDRVEKNLTYKGWNKTEKIPAQAEYCKWEEEGGEMLGWVEPCESPFGSGVARKASSEEELNECGEDGDKVGATVLAILQKRTSGAAAAGGEASGWDEAWFERYPALAGMSFLYSEEPGT